MTVQQQLDNMKITHNVLKIEDIKKLPQNMQNELASIAWQIRQKRKVEMKNPLPQYIVVNIDENPQMIQELIDVLQRHGKWG